MKLAIYFLLISSCALADDASVNLSEPAPELTPEANPMLLMQEPPQVMGKNIRYLYG